MARKPPKPALTLWRSGPHLTHPSLSHSKWHSDPNSRFSRINHRTDTYRHTPTNR